MDIENEIPIGWKSIFEPIKRYVRRYNFFHPFNRIKITHVKVNNGLLEFEAKNATAELIKLFNKAKEESLNTCMICGSTNNVGIIQDGTNSVICYACVLSKIEKIKENISWFSNNESEEMIIPYIESNI